MRVNHLNLTVTDVPGTRDLLEEYFGLRAMEGSQDDEPLAVLFDDAGMVLTLMKAGRETEVRYPPTFHIGFIQESEERVNEINRRLRDDGFDVKPPRVFHGAWTFYFRAPGGFLIEVLS